jgi:hypothetical protein
MIAPRARISRDATLKKMFGGFLMLISLKLLLF